MRGALTGASKVQPDPGLVPAAGTPVHLSLAAPAQAARFVAVSVVACAMILASPVLPPAAAQEAAEGTASVLGVSNTLNPAISFNGLVLGTWSDAVESAHQAPAEDAAEESHGHGGAPSDGFQFQEGELILSAVVDPFFQAWVTLASSPAEGTGIEEAYAFATSLPKGIGLKAGMFYLPFGKHNPLHTHQYPFVNPPVGVASLLGQHGITDAGVEGSILLPTPWYLEVTAYAVDGGAERFRDEADRLAAGGRAYSLLEIGDETTIELGASVLDAPVEQPHHEETPLAAEDDVFHGNAQLFLGGDLTVRWQDLRRSFGPAVHWQTEFLTGHPDEGPDQLGLYSLVRYRFTRRWWLGAGYSFYQEEREDPSLRRVHEARGQFAFVPSEFSTVRTEVRWQRFPDDRIADGGDREDEWTAYVQLNFTIGSHPAHKY